MKSVIKVILLVILSFGIWINYTWAALQEDDGSSGSVLKWDWTRIPICAKWECWANWNNLEKWWNKVKTLLKDDVETSKKFSTYVQDFIKYLLGFITVVWVIYIIYAWLLLLTSAWEEEKMTRARKNIFYVMIWITVIYLAYPIVNWALKAIS